jgi:sulfite exporter TauE/SafE
MSGWIPAALIMGLAGSVHCAGMCGPIALVVAGNNPEAKTRGILLYNLGRVLTYTLLGTLSGLAGHTVLWFTGQQWLSVIAGCLILLSVLLVYYRLPFMSRISDALLKRLRVALGAVMKNRTPGTLLYMGALNGLLPCGLVYAALGGAAGTGSALNGAVFMALFGTATVPVLFTISLLGNKLPANYYRTLVKLVPVTMSIMAVLLIVRGLGLGIPYLSPEITSGAVACCHAR